jgi:hypothetical protein
VAKEAASVSTMNLNGATKVERRVEEAAEAALAERHFATAIDVFVGLGWLVPARVDEWRQGRVDYLERVIQANLAKISDATKFFRRWARDRGLVPSETAYVARTRDRRPLRFSVSGDPAIERAYRTHWLSPALSEQKRQRLAERAARPPDLLVISPLGDFTCTACEGNGDLLIMEDPGPLCLGCADLDHLVFLPSGEAALTRRAKKASSLSAVVVRFSRTRKRYERQGLLVEEAALEAAERECLADQEARARRRRRDEERRAISDRRVEAELAAAIVLLYPGCPGERADHIARHTAARGSGRIGRSAPGRNLDPDAVALAVAASIRHEDTSYDRLLMSGVPRAEARARVRDEVHSILEKWQATTAW